MKNKFGFNFLFRIHYAFKDLNVDFAPFNVFNYSISEDRLKEIKTIIGVDAFQKEYAQGNEIIHIKQYGNLKIVHMENLIRGCGKTLMCQQLCKRVKNSVYANNRKALLRFAVDPQQQTVFCSRPADLNKLNGKIIRLLCFDDFSMSQVSNIKYYIEPLIRLTHNEPMTAVFIG